MRKKKTKVARKGSITATMIAVLSRAAVPADDVIVSEVRAKHKPTKFSKSHLAWYKSKFRVGALTGMPKGHHAIAQKHTAKKKAAKKPAKRRGVKRKGSGLKPKKKA